MPGPVPKRSDQRRRRNKTPEGAELTTAPARAAPEAPEAEDGWHPRAAEWFTSLAKSGQSAYYEASDWAMAKLAADLMTSLLNADKPSAQLVASLLQLTTNLMTTEGDRRRLRLELARGPQIDEDEVAADATVTSLRSRLGG